MRAGSPVKPPTDKAPGGPRLPWCNTGGCTRGPDRPCRAVNVWTRQHKELVLADADLIVDCNIAAE